MTYKQDYSLKIKSHPDDVITVMKYSRKMGHKHKVPLKKIYKIEIILYEIISNIR